MRSHSGCHHETLGWPRQADPRPSRLFHEETIPHVRAQDRQAARTAIAPREQPVQFKDKVKLTLTLYLNRQQAEHLSAPDR
jgi:hypothetical protein